MDSFFGIGLPELVLILILAGLVMGPHRIRQVARIFGRVTAQLQRVSREFARQLNSELDAVGSGEMRNTLNDMRSLQEEVEALRKELAQVPRTFQDVTDSVASEGKKVVEEGKQALDFPKNTGRDSTKAEDGDAGAGPDSDIQVSERPPLPNLIDVPEDPES